jgi:hypothetical protein
MSGIFSNDDGADDAETAGSGFELMLALVTAGMK